RPLALVLVVEACAPEGGPVLVPVEPGDKACLDQVAMLIVLVVAGGEGVKLGEGLGRGTFVDLLVPVELVEVELLRQAPDVAVPVDPLPDKRDEVALL